MSKEETVEISIKVPKNVVAALREFVLKHDPISEQEYWEREAIESVIADIDFFCDKERIDGGDPEPTIKKYGLENYHDC